MPGCRSLSLRSAFYHRLCLSVQALELQPVQPTARLPQPRGLGVTPREYVHAVRTAGDTEERALVFHRLSDRSAARIPDAGGVAHSQQVFAVWAPGDVRAPTIVLKGLADRLGAERL